MVSGLLWGQATTSLHGTIYDANGACCRSDRHHHGSADGIHSNRADGERRNVPVSAVAPYGVRVEVSATGFAKLKREDARLQVNTPATMNFTMQVSATKVEIEVTTEAPLVNTQDASIGNAFTPRQLIDLPAEGRDPVAILSLQPGVTFIGGNWIDQSNDSRGGAVAGHAVTKRISRGTVWTITTSCAAMLLRAPCGLRLNRYRNFASPPTAEIRTKAAHRERRCRS